MLRQGRGCRRAEDNRQTCHAQGHQTYCQRQRQRQCCQKFEAAVWQATAFIASVNQKDSAWCSWRHYRNALGSTERVASCFGAEVPTLHLWRLWRSRVAVEIFLGDVSWIQPVTPCLHGTCSTPWLHNTNPAVWRRRQRAKEGKFSSLELRICDRIVWFGKGLVLRLQGSIKVQATDPAGWNSTCTTTTGWHWLAKGGDANGL